MYVPDIEVNQNDLNFKRIKKTHFQMKKLLKAIAVIVILTRCTPVVQKDTQPVYQDLPFTQDYNKGSTLLNENQP